MLFDILDADGDRGGDDLVEETSLGGLRDAGGFDGSTFGPSIDTLLRDARPRIAAAAAEGSDVGDVNECNALWEVLSNARFQEELLLSEGSTTLFLMENFTLLSHIAVGRRHPAAALSGVVHTDRLTMPSAPRDADPSISSSVLGGGGDDVNTTIGSPPAAPSSMSQDAIDVMYLAQEAALKALAAHPSPDALKTILDTDNNTPQSGGRASSSSSSSGKAEDTSKQVLAHRTISMYEVKRQHRNSLFSAALSSVCPTTPSREDWKLLRLSFQFLLDRLVDDPHHTAELESAVATLCTKSRRVAPEFAVAVRGRLHSLASSSRQEQGSDGQPRPSRPLWVDHEEGSQRQPRLSSCVRLLCGLMPIIAELCASTSPPPSIKGKCLQAFCTKLLSPEDPAPETPQTSPQAVSRTNSNEFVFPSPPSSASNRIPSSTSGENLATGDEAPILALALEVLFDPATTHSLPQPSSYTEAVADAVDDEVVLLRWGRRSFSRLLFEHAEASRTWQSDVQQYADDCKQRARRGGQEPADNDDSMASSTTSSSLLTRRYITFPVEPLHCVLLSAVAEWSQQQFQHLLSPSPPSSGIDTTRTLSSVSPMDDAVTAVEILTALSSCLCGGGGAPGNTTTICAKKGESFRGALAALGQAVTSQRCRNADLLFHAVVTLAEILEPFESPFHKIPLSSVIKASMPCEGLCRDVCHGCGRQGEKEHPFCLLSLEAVVIPALTASQQPTGGVQTASEVFATQLKRICVRRTSGREQPDEYTGDSTLSEKEGSMNARLRSRGSSFASASSSTIGCGSVGRIGVESKGGDERTAGGPPPENEVVCAHNVGALLEMQRQYTSTVTVVFDVKESGSGSSRGNNVALNTRPVPWKIDRKRFDPNCTTHTPTSSPSWNQPLSPAHPPGAAIDLFSMDVSPTTSTTTTTSVSGAVSGGGTGQSPHLFSAADAAQQNAAIDLFSAWPM